MISESTFNKVRDELFELASETYAKKTSFVEFNKEVERIQKENEVPGDEMILILDMLIRWISENGEKDA